MNKVMLVGNLGRDAEVTSTKVGLSKVGLSIVNFPVATSEHRKNEDGDKSEMVTWHKVTIFGKMAEGLSPYLKKGMKVSVIGRISNTTYDKQDGSKGYSSKVIAQEIELLGSASKQAQTSPEGDNGQNDDDLPF